MVIKKFQYLFDLEKGQTEQQALKLLRNIPAYKACLKKLNYRNKMGYVLSKDLATLAAFWIESFNKNMKFVQDIRTINHCALDFCERVLFKNMPVYVIDKQIR